MIYLNKAVLAISVLTSIIDVVISSGDKEHFTGSSNHNKGNKNLEQQAKESSNSFSYSHFGRNNNQNRRSNKDDSNINKISRDTTSVSTFAKSSTLSQQPDPSIALLPRGDQQSPVFNKDSGEGSSYSGSSPSEQSGFGSGFSGQTSIFGPGSEFGFTAGAGPGFGTQGFNGFPQSTSFSTFGYFPVSAGASASPTPEEIKPGVSSGRAPQGQSLARFPQGFPLTGFQPGTTLGGFPQGATFGGFPGATFGGYPATFGGFPQGATFGSFGPAFQAGAGLANPIPGYPQGVPLRGAAQGNLPRGHQYAFASPVPVPVPVPVGNQQLQRPVQPGQSFSAGR